MTSFVVVCLVLSAAVDIGAPSWEYVTSKLHIFWCHLPVYKHHRWSKLILKDENVARLRL